ncbi:MAG: XdhC family protein [Haloarculaceae archaeon]
MTDADWTASEHEVLAAAGDCLAADRPAVLATVTGVEGRAYRRPGAKMLVRESGAHLGHVTADCLEARVRRLAASVLEAGAARVETFDLRSDESEAWGLGVGCDGVIDLLLEPVGPGLDPVTDAAAAGRPVAAVAVLDGPAAGARATYLPAGDSSSHPADDSSGTPTGAPSSDGEPGGEWHVGPDFPRDLVDELTATAATFAVEGQSDTRVVDGTTVFVDGVAPPPTLLVVGTGHDLAPVVSVADTAGFSVTVVGYRGAQARAERFPAADAVRSTSPRSLREAVDLDGDTYAVVATHNLVDDRLTVEALLDSPVPYVGVLGPRERFAELLSASDRTLSAADRERVYAPVGLDIGGGTPGQIALSVVSEIQAVRAGRDPGHLSERDGPIHDRPDRRR